MSDAALAKLISDYEAKIKLADLATEKLRRDLAAEQKTNKAICDASVAKCEAVLQACETDRSRQRSIYEAALSKCSTDPPWYKSPMFSFIMGSVVAGGVCGVSAGLGNR